MRGKETLRQRGWVGGGGRGAERERGGGKSENKREAIGSFVWNLSLELHIKNEKRTLIHE